KKCRGACGGHEAALAYNQRVDDALARWRLTVWPHVGPVIIEERGDQKTEFHLVHEWCHIATSDYRADLLVAQGEPVFDYDTYKILLRFFTKPPANVRVYGV